MSKKSKTENTVAWSAPPATHATDELQSMVGKGADYSTSIRNAYARSGEESKRLAHNSLGAYTTADVQGKTMKADNERMHQNMGADLANAAIQSQQAQFGQQAQVAGLTAPQMYNSSQSTVQKDPWGTAMQVAQVGAGAALGGSGKA